MNKFLIVIFGVGLMTLVTTPSAAVETTQPPPVMMTDPVSATPKNEDENGEADVTMKVGPNGDLVVSDGGSDVSCIDLYDEYGNTGESRVGASNAVFDPDGIVVPVSGRLYSPSGKWRYLHCVDAAGGYVVGDLVPINGPAVTLGELGSRALGVLDPALPGSSVNPDDKQVVQFPSLFGLILDIGTLRWLILRLQVSRLR